MSLLFLLKETREEKVKYSQYIWLLIFKAQTNKEEVLLYVLQLASITLLRSCPPGQLLEYF